MDRLAKRFDGVQDGDLVLFEARGLAYQRDARAQRVTYDRSYYDKVCAYEGTPIAKAVNAGRVELLRKWATLGRLVDWGAGSGAFVRDARAAGFEAFGYDVLADAAAALKAASLWEDNFTSYDRMTMWDVLEHLEDPGAVLQFVKKGALLFLSVPIFPDLQSIRQSKHYRPGEHLHYWTRDGLVAWMALYNFSLLDESDHEIRAGREQIGAFVFRRDLPDYGDYIGLYDKLHSTSHYGNSSSELHLDRIAQVVRRINPRSIIDYGCGRSDLVSHFWLDGARTIARFDPAIPRFKDFPEGRFDLAFCCDVMEHIPMLGIERVLTELKSKSDTAVFTISMKLARAKLPDGRNAHATILTRGEWVRWISEYFSPVKNIDTPWAHELMLVAGEKRSEEDRCSLCTAALYLDSYTPIGRAKEYFMRCENCGALSRSGPNEGEARKIWHREGVCSPVI